MRSLWVACALQVTAFASSPAQTAVALRVGGDTSHAPPGCAAKAAINAITAWFRAFNDADSTTLARVLAPQFVVSTGKHWIVSDRHQSFENSLPSLLAYVRLRHAKGERIVLQSISFTGWRDRKLGFIPNYLRSAEDLGPRPLVGIGKGEYWCPTGIRALNMAPASMAVRAPSNEEL